MDKCKSKDLLKTNKIRATAKRIAILDEIIGQKNPINAQDLHAQVTEKVNLDLATVYRVLHLLGDNNIVREIVDQDGVQYYELSCTHKPIHPHFKCKVCENFSCLKFFDFRDTLNLMKFAQGYEITDVSIILRGFCPNCQPG